MSEEVGVARWIAGELASLVQGTLTGDAGAAAFAVTTDSRKVREGDVFFALDGARVRGRTFVPNAFGAGCSVVVVDSEWEGEVPSGRAAIRVASPLQSLGLLAKAVRASWTCPVIAITGSAGKTTVKEMVAHLLEATGPVFKSPGNFNTVEGLSRAILELETMPRVAVLEAGASAPGEVARLAEIAAPTSVAITKIGAAHLEGFGTLNDVAREKGDLARAVAKNRLVVLNGDDPFLVDLATELECRVKLVGLGPGNACRVVQREMLPDGGTSFRLASGAQGTLQVLGEHQLTNALLALALAVEEGLPLEVGLERLATFTGVAGRLGVKRHAGVSVVDDTYNANPASMAAALQWFGEWPCTGRKAVALGDMLELGKDSAKYHAELGAWVVERNVDLAVFVGAESRAAHEEAVRRTRDKSKFRHAEDSDSAARILEHWVRPGDAVLVKGSRGVRMERVVRALIPEEGGAHAV